MLTTGQNALWAVKLMATEMEQHCTQTMCHPHLQTSTDTVVLQFLICPCWLASTLLCHVPIRCTSPIKAITKQAPPPWTPEIEMETGFCVTPDMGCLKKLFKCVFLTEDNLTLEKARLVREWESADKHMSLPAQPDHQYKRHGHHRQVSLLPLWEIRQSCPRLLV